MQELYERFNVSTLIVAGGSSDYLGVARHVMAMRNYQPVCMTGEVGRLGLPGPKKPSDPLMIQDRRRLLAVNFDPAYTARRLGKTLAVRIKTLRLRERVLEYGNSQLNLTRSIRTRSWPWAMPCCWVKKPSGKLSCRRQSWPPP